MKGIIPILGLTISILILLSLLIGFEDIMKKLSSLVQRFWRPEK
jgi:Na+-transporting methylmalonyl-CoA/oxaloacetate decarboxylase gamma subunit